MKMPPLHAVRDVSTFLVGLSGIVHETFFATNARETLIALFGVMIGLPAVAGFDIRRKSSSTTDIPSSTSEPQQSVSSSETES